MSYLQNLHWVTLSIIGLVGLTPVTMMYAILKNKFGTDVPVIFLWYALPFSIWSALLCFGSRSVTSSNIIPSSLWVIAVAVGAAACTTLGTFCTFTATTKADNPGMPIAIVGGVAVLTYFLSPGLRQLFPNTFPPASVDGYGILALLLLIAAAVVIALRK